MTELTTSPIFGLSLSIFAYLIGILVHRRFPNPLTTPLLFATVLIILFLEITKIPYKNYYVGGSYLNTLIVPSTVALAIPLYRNFHLMKHHYRSILAGISISTLINTLYTALIAKIFGMDYFLTISLFPKSVTTAMAIGISDKMGGMTTVTLVVVVVTGILTSVIGPSFLRLLHINDPVAVGLALGGTGHAVGTGAALRYGPVQGAMAGLAIGITGIMYVIISPIIAQLILKQY
ncbi:LrgB family protein [Streptococcus saliviloxodontae]|uniref:Murein hydrolase (TIGR00659 family) n=1 Tax=Streptococcus saliviloxodontae TaxID=1349416 RepID=A0ABS2PLT0_9STRE|nr:LrgB family protein [Streptococcus saliviloxodontae]MBM7636395.1 putative murein hydrolase (TIGR00659 family) [Streptococcus saliviloxodontae]